MSDHSFPVTGPVDIVTKIGFGSVTVHTRDNVSEAEVTLSARDASSDIVARTTVELQGRELVISGPRPRGNLLDLQAIFGGNSGRDALDVVVRVPSGSGVKVASVAADVRLTGRAGTVDIASGNSTIELDTIDGDARIRFGAGPVRITTLRGAANVRAASADVSVGEADGDVDVRFGAGSLDIASARGKVRMKTGAGSAHIGSAEADVDLTSGTGEISIGIPAGQQARLDVMTGIGKLHTEMPVEQAPRGPGRIVRIHAVTGSGDVTIRRAG